MRRAREEVLRFFTSGKPLHHMPDICVVSLYCPGRGRERDPDRDRDREEAVEEEQELAAGEEPLAVGAFRDQLHLLVPADGCGCSCMLAACGYRASRRHGIACPALRTAGKLCQDLAGGAE